jgi:hypothetical protein
MDLVELKAAGNLSMSHIQDSTLFGNLTLRYQEMLKRIRNNNQQVPNTGYTMYRNRRTKNRGVY